MLIGSTDIRADDPDAALCEPAEQDYMLSVMREIFPAIALGARDMLYRYCGVRPLPYSTSSDPGEISRDHSIRQDTLPGGGAVLSLIGGKWTTFRGFAEEVADRVLMMLETPRRASTRTCAIGGGAGLPADDAARAAWMARVASAHGLDTARVAILLERYGSTAESVAAWCAAGPDRALASLADYSVREIGRLCQEEMVETLADLLFRRTDVALSGRLTRAVAAGVAHFGRLDILINSAGIALLDPAHAVSDAAWDRTMAINLRAPFLLARAAGAGRIVTLASQAATVALDRHLAYCASKAGLLGMTKVLALEWAPFGITVNAISPTVVETELGRKAWAGDVGEAMKRKIPTGRFAQPEEIAHAALFLASAAAGMINGENLVVDGGYTIQ